MKHIMEQFKFIFKTYTGQYPETTLQATTEITISAKSYQSAINSIWEHSAPELKALPAIDIKKYKSGFRTFEPVTK